MVGFLLPFVQLVTLAGSPETVAEEVNMSNAGTAGCNPELVLLGCSDINSRRNTAKNKRQFPLCWKYVQLYFQTDGNTMWM